MLSVIIPNYNYEQFLHKRIISVIHQTVKPDEIIFLDDNSTDNSCSLAHALLSNSGISFQIIKNASNSGSVFSQWEKGVNAAKGDIVWIAEADDYADSRFLELLLPAFSNSDVSLAYCESALINEEGTVFTKTKYRDLHNTIVPGKWINEYTNSGPDEIRSNLCIRNTIPNVSGVLLKKSAVNAVLPIPKNFKLSGDWYAYIEILKNGAIYYNNQILNYHRYHKKRVTSSVIHQNLYFKEYFEIIDHIKKSSTLSSQTENKILTNIFYEATHFGSIPAEVIVEIFKRFNSTSVSNFISEELSNFYSKKKSNDNKIINRLKKITFSKVVSQITRKKI